uniref:Uncharacterized protein n=1 Tax=Arundo donax TaxID=35708 RepID=A0A0A9EXE2_ARUDO
MCFDLAYASRTCMQVLMWVGTLAFSFSV